MIRSRWATVTGVLAERPGVLEVGVALEDGAPDGVAFAYPALVGEVRAGDRVLLNTTAVALGLGTGGWHFVILVERPDEVPVDVDGPGSGHVIKLRYTPLQLRALAVEEPDSPHHRAMASATSLDGTPVVWVPLHSMLGPAVAGARAAGAERVAYVMSDGAALPAAFSRLAADLRACGLLDTVVSCGQAFGGDLEAVSLFSGLLAARHVAAADVIVVGDGPGNTGTETPWGSTSVASALALSAVAILGGRAVATLRISFADQRDRHRGVSHHSITALTKIVAAGAHVAVPEIADPVRRDAVWHALTREGLHERHRLIEATGAPALGLLSEHGIQAESMGRTQADDPEFFLAAGAAGNLAGGMAARSRARPAGEPGTAAPP